MAIPLTLMLGHRIADAHWGPLPAEILAVVRAAFADSVGVMAAGCTQPCTTILAGVLGRPDGESRVLFGRVKTDAPQAAWINATAMHALDFDDVDSILRGHPSTVLVPAILAEAASLNTTGREMALAYSVGHRVWAELSTRDADLPHESGWHPTGVFGSIAAAAACASLRRLDARAAACAIALAASQSAGLVSNVGTMTKPFHAGHAAHSGILSARLAEQGYTASLDALEHAPGFLHAISPARRIDLDTAVPDPLPWRSHYTIKKYPICFCAHRAVDGALDIVRQYGGPKPGDIGRIFVTTSRRNAEFLHHHAPKNALEAKFSMEFAVACAFMTGHVDLVQMTDGFVQCADMRALMRRVIISEAQGADPTLVGYAQSDSVAVETHSGALFESGPITHVRGDPREPLKSEALWQKFRGCFESGGFKRDVKRLFDALIRIDEVENASALDTLILEVGHEN